MTPPPGRRQGTTLVELVLAIALGAILFVLAPVLMAHGVRAMVYLPRAAAVNQAATEIMYQVFEGGFSTLQAAPIPGLRSATRAAVAGALTAPLWLAENDRIGYLTANGQRVLIRLTSEQIRRSLPASGACPPATPITEEVLPYEAAGPVRILTAGSTFQYYNQAGAQILPAPGCTALLLATVRRVQMAIIAQTGNGLVNEAQAQEPMTTSLAIIDP